jgi:hypothetical protein
MENMNGEINVRNRSLSNSSNNSDDNYGMCSITFENILNLSQQGRSCITSTGHIYDSNAISEWLIDKDVDPNTGIKLKSKCILKIDREDIKHLGTNKIRKITKEYFDTLIPSKENVEHKKNIEQKEQKEQISKQIIINTKNFLLINDISFESCSFEEDNMSYIVYNNCSFCQSTFVKCNISNCIFENCNFDNCLFIKTNFNGKYTIFEKCKTTENTSFYDCYFEFSNINKYHRYIKSKINNSNLINSTQKKKHQREYKNIKNNKYVLQNPELFCDILQYRGLQKIKNQEYKVDNYNNSKDIKEINEIKEIKDIEYKENMYNNELIRQYWLIEGCIIGNSDYVFRLCNKFPDIIENIDINRLLLKITQNSNGKNISDITNTLINTNKKIGKKINVSKLEKIFGY